MSDKPAGFLLLRYLLGVIDVASFCSLVVLPHALLGARLVALADGTSFSHRPGDSVAVG